MSDNTLPKPKMMEYRRHITVCVGPRCTENGEGQALYDMLGDKLKQAGLTAEGARVKRTRGTCFGTCKSGPLLCVQPDGTWYYNVTSENLDRIISEHLQNGNKVDDLVFHQGPNVEA